MLKNPTRIFQIIGKQVINDKVIKFILHDNINYLNSISNHIYCANIYPHHNYQIGDYLGISVGEIEKGGDRGYPSSEVFANKSMVNKVKKPPKDYNGFTFNDLEFGMGWMEKED
jgi:hypothetical protein